MTLHEIRVPQMGVNDRSANLSELYVNNGDEVASGTIICLLETSKAAIDIETPHKGYLKWVVEVGQEVPIQSLLAVVGHDRDAVLAYADTPVAKGDSTSFTRKAQTLMDEHGLTPSAFAHITGRTVRTSDVFDMLAAAEKESANTAATFEPALCKRIAVLSARPGAQAIVSTALAAGIEVLCVIDDRLCESMDAVFGVPVVSEQQFKLNHLDQIEGIYLHLQKDRKFQVLPRFEALGLTSPTIIHPTAIVALQAHIAPGVLIKAGAVVGAGCQIHPHAIVDNGAVVPHHCEIGRFVHIAPGVSMGGLVHIEDGVVAGIGASISPEVRIGRGSIILPGASVREDVPPFSIIDGIHQIVGRAKELVWDHVNG